MVYVRNYVTPTDVNQIPNGELAAVKGSPFDFTTPHPIGERIKLVRNPLPLMSLALHPEGLQANRPSMLALHLLERTSCYSLDGGYKYPMILGPF